MPTLSDNNLEWIYQNARTNGGRHTYSELAHLFGFEAGYQIRNRYRTYADRRQTLKEIPAPEPPPGYTAPPEPEEDPTRAKFTESGNYAEASAIGPQIKTLNDLIAACSIDLDVWVPGQPEFKVWDGWAKKERSDLVWKEGRILEGFVKKQGLETVTLYSVSCQFRRRIPIEIRPAIRPVCAQIRIAGPPEPTSGSGRSLVIADPHIGFVRENMSSMRLIPLHDRRVLDLAIQIAQIASVDRIDILGDWNDWADTTDRFVRSPEYQFLTQPAIFEAHFHLARLRAACPAATMTFHEGNHEARWADAILKHIAWAYDLRPADAPTGPGLLTIQNALGLDGLGIRWVGGYPDDDDWVNDAVHLSHGPYAQVPGNTAKAMAYHSDAIEIFGHIHRREQQGRTIWLRDGPRTIEAICPGCACHIDGRVPGNTAKQQWQQGLLVLDFERDGSGYGFTQIPIDNGACYFQGIRLEARPIVPELAATFPDWEWGAEI